MRSCLYIPGWREEGCGYRVSGEWGRVINRVLVDEEMTDKWFMLTASLGLHVQFSTFSFTVSYAILVSGMLFFK